MPGRRIAGLGLLAGCFVFYIAYGEWFSWLLLMLILALPWLSLALSLPMMLSFRVTLEGAETVPQGTRGDLWLQGRCRLPMAPFRGQIRLRRCFTGEEFTYAPAAGIPSEHCGGYQVTARRVRVCDYLGLFAWPVALREPHILRIRPKPVPILQLPEPDNFQAKAWRPKFGGGYAENHELRLYRPGDSLNQIHWKVTAKTGKWTIREPMEPQRGLILVTMDLCGTPEELDRKLGRLLWLGNHLLEKDVAFQLRVMTGAGIFSGDIRQEDDLLRQLDALLCAPAAETGTLEGCSAAVSWLYHIGGAPDEN